MSIIASPDFGDEIRRTLEQFLEGLKAIMAIKSDDEFLRRLEELLGLLRSTERFQSPKMPNESSALIDGAPQAPRVWRPERRDGSKQTDAQAGGFDDQFERIEALLESVAGEKVSYTPKAIAKLERVKPATVREWIKIGKIRAVPDPNRMAGPHSRHVILAEDYEKFKRAGH